MEKEQYRMITIYASSSCIQRLNKIKSLGLSRGRAIQQALDFFVLSGKSFITKKRVKYEIESTEFKVN